MIGVYMIELSLNTFKYYVPSSIKNYFSHKVWQKIASVKKSILFENKLKKYFFHSFLNDFTFLSGGMKFSSNAL